MDKNTNRKTVRSRRPVKRPRKDDTVYTEAKPVNISRFIVRIATVIAVVLAVVFGMSIFFKTEKIEVAGANKYTVAQIQEASKIMDGSNLLTLNKAQIAGRILTQLPYISEVRIGIRLPDTVIIEVKETTVAYAAQNGDDAWCLVSCEGKVLEKIDGSAFKNNARILGVRLDNPEIGKTAVALEKTQSDAETPITIYERERLSAALQIAQEMEKNSVLGALVSIDVTDMGNIEVWYGQRFQIFLGNSNDISMKVFHVVDVINRLNPYESGVLDASFTTYPDQVYYKSFE